MLPAAGSSLCQNYRKQVDATTRQDCMQHIGFMQSDTIVRGSSAYSAK